jgi:putative peptidoglycan lipid II flippase
MTMLSRVLGLLRDILFARFLGAGGDADAFYVAFKIPNFLRRLFAEGAFAQAFVPVLSEYRENGSVAAVRHFIDRVAGCLGVTLLGVVALVVLCSPVVTAVFGSGFLFRDEYDKFWLTSDMVRITFPYLFLVSMTGFAGSILNSYDRFAVPALTPVVLNLCLIIAAACISPLLDRPVFALAWGVFVAGILQLCLQLPFLARLGLLPRPKVDWKDESVRKVLRLMAPAMFGVSISQINLTLDTVLASFLIDGSITWLYFSDRLIELPLGVFGVGIATVILPNLSRKFAANDDRFSATIDWGIRIILLIGVPATIALIVLAEPILMTLFQYDQMRSHDIDMASFSLKAYALGLSAFMLIKVFASAYFSRQDTRTPVRIGIIAMVANMVLNLAFVLPLMWFWNLGHVGLALATTCSAFLNASLLYRGLRKNNVLLRSSGWLVFLSRLIPASTLMCVVLFFLASRQPSYIDLDVWQRITSLSYLVAAGGVTYLAVLVLAGMRMRDLKHV